MPLIEREILVLFPNVSDENIRPIWESYINIIINQQHKSIFTSQKAVLKLKRNTDREWPTFCNWKVMLHWVGFLITLFLQNAFKFWAIHTIPNSFPNELGKTYMTWFLDFLRNFKWSKRLLNCIVIIFCEFWPMTKSTYKQNWGWRDLTIRWQLKYNNIISSFRSSHLKTSWKPFFISRTWSKFMSL